MVNCMRDQCPTVKSSNTLTRTSTIKLKYRVLSLFVFCCERFAFAVSEFTFVVTELASSVSEFCRE